MTQPFDIIKGSLRSIGALASGESPDPDSANDAFNLLNDMLDQWSNSSMMVFNTQEIIFTLTPGIYVYTIGSGGAINTTRPLTIKSAFVRVSNLDYPVSILSIEDYELIGLKSLSGPWPRGLYYNAGVPLGTLTFWPNPNSGEMHMFTDQVFSRFATINDTINFTQGYNNALRFNLALLLCPEYGKTASPELVKAANDGISFVKGTNMQPAQIARFDSVLNSGRRNDASWILTGGFMN